MNIKLKIWRQPGPGKQGRFFDYSLEDIIPEMSFLEMLDVLNEKIIKSGEQPIEFDYDCREGICGACGLVINGQPHGPDRGVTTCQVHMRSFKDGDTVTIEPWRSTAFPVVRDLIVDRSALDRIIGEGGYTSVRTGPQPDANAMLIPKERSDYAFDAAACIGCGACVAACPNASASLFTGAKITHLALLPQGAPERTRRAESMVAQMDAEQFGSCTNIGECTAACPKSIPLTVIAKMKAEYLRGLVVSD